MLSSHPRGARPFAARAKRQLRAIREHLFEAYEHFQADDGDLLAGGIAFFSVLSMAPTLLIALALASRVLGGRAVSGALVSELRPVLGQTSAAFVAEVIERTQASGLSSHAAAIGAFVTLYASTRMFITLQTALNRVWRVSPRDLEGLRARALAHFEKRLLSFALILGLGVLLAATVVVKAIFTSLAAHVGLNHVPVLWRAADLGISFAALVAIVTATYRLLPDARIAMRHAVRGGLLTAAFLSIGTLLVGAYFDSFGVASGFGAAGSLVVFMLSSYYGAIIFLFGAELTGVAARRDGGLTPSQRPGPPAERPAAP